jgi:hypothetical protein
MPNIQEIIVSAIHQKLIITATYQGYQRIMCPHVIGYKKGVLNALFFQFAGGSKSGLAPGGQWRCVHVDELSGVSSAPGPWHTADNHTRPAPCVDQGEIIAEVAY